MGSRHEREPLPHHLFTDNRFGAGIDAGFTGRRSQPLHRGSCAHSGAHGPACRQMSAERPLVEVIDLDFAYRQGEGWTRILHGVSFTVSRGEAFGLVGESGCGKSTVAYQLLAYRRESGRIQSGRIVFQGTDLQTLDRPALDRLRGNRMSLVPQNPTTALSPGMRVGRQIAEVLQYHGAFAGKEVDRVEYLFRLVGLPNPSTIGHQIGRAHV